MPFRGVSAHLLIGQAREEWIEKVKQGKIGNRNPNWKGGIRPQIFDGYFSLHRWVKRQLPRPKLCQCCYKKSAIDCANKSGEYKRDLDDWWWICRHCHMEIDGRLKNFHFISANNWEKLRRGFDGRFIKQGG